MYASDIVVLASNVFDLQRKIAVISKYFKENDLNVYLSETKIVMVKYWKAPKVKLRYFGVMKRLIL
jgi:hypothetical protein